VDKCPTCGEKLSEDTVMACVWQQGRCPYRPPMIDLGQVFNKLINWLKGKK